MLIQSIILLLEYFSKFIIECFEYSTVLITLTQALNILCISIKGI